MTPATAMGQMNQRRQNIGSTSKVSIKSNIEDTTCTPAGLGSKTHLESAKNNLMYIGDQGVKILATITQNIIQNITKIYAD
jgi:hypothetical protein